MSDRRGVEMSAPSRMVRTPLRGRCAVLPLMVLLGMASMGRAADEAALEAAFERAAGLDGSAYAVARDVLLRQGKAIEPLLERKAGSEDWRRWSLACSWRCRSRPCAKS